MHFKPILKLNIMLLSSVLGVIWMGNILLMHFVNYLIHMELFTTRLHYTSCTNTLEQNDVVERKHRHIFEIVHSLLLYACVPTEF